MYIYIHIQEIDFKVVSAKMESNLKLHLKRSLLGESFIHEILKL